MHSLFNYSLNCEYPGIQLSIEGCKPSNVGAPAISASVPTSRHTSFIDMIIKKAHSSIYVTVSWESFPASAFFSWVLEPCLHPLQHSCEYARWVYACCWTGLLIDMGRLASSLQHHSFPSNTVFRRYILRALSLVWNHKRQEKTVFICACSTHHPAHWFLHIAWVLWPFWWCKMHSMSTQAGTLCCIKVSIYFIKICKWPFWWYVTNG